ncbi:hypothetical protein BGW42_003834 [Actinomortierella wolfii]|nr:hypothetical protein BGW42_003834 [Actinomortierella wolfii]
MSSSCTSSPATQPINMLQNPVALLARPEVQVADAKRLQEFQSLSDPPVSLQCYTCVYGAPTNSTPATATKQTDLKLLKRYLASLTPPVASAGINNPVLPADKHASAIHVTEEEITATKQTDLKLLKRYLASLAPPATSAGINNPVLPADKHASTIHVPEEEITAALAPEPDVTGTGDHAINHAAEGVGDGYSSREVLGDDSSDESDDEDNENSEHSPAAEINSHDLIATVPSGSAGSIGNKGDIGLPTTSDAADDDIASDSEDSPVHRVGVIGETSTYLNEHDLDQIELPDLEAEAKAPMHDLGKRILERCQFARRGGLRFDEETGEASFRLDVSDFSKWKSQYQDSMRTAFIHHEDIVWKKEFKTTSKYRCECYGSKRQRRPLEDMTTEATNDVATNTGSTRRKRRRNTNKNENEMEDTAPIGKRHRRKPDKIRLSMEMKSTIKSMVLQGSTAKSILAHFEQKKRDYLSRDLSDSERNRFTTMRDNNLTYNDVYNIWYKVNKENIQMDPAADNSCLR